MSYENKNSNASKPPPVYQSSLVYEVDKGSGIRRVASNNYNASNIEDRNVNNALNRSNLQDRQHQDAEARSPSEIIIKKDSNVQYEDNRVQRETVNGSAIHRGDERQSTMNEAVMGLLNKKESNTYSNKGNENNR